MPILKLTDDFGLAVDAPLNDNSSLTKYLKDAASLKFDAFNAKAIFDQPLSSAAPEHLKIGLNFDRAIPVGTDRVKLTVKATAGMTLDVIPPSAATLMDDMFGAPISIQAGEYYVGITLSATVSADMAVKEPQINFGFAPSTQATFTTYRRFTAPLPTFGDALKTALAEFTIPADLQDLSRITPNMIVSASGNGVLKGSIVSNLPTITNPLAAANLPVVGKIAVKQTASISAGANISLTADYQVRAWTDAGQLQLGIYCSKAKAIDLSASLDADLTAGIGTSDLLTKALQSISTDATLDVTSLKAAGLSNDQISSMRDAVTAAIQRKIMLSLSFTLENRQKDEAVFLCKLNLAAMDKASSNAIEMSLAGNLSPVNRPGTALKGVVLLRSILTDTHDIKHSLIFNLLGIYSIGTVTSLVVQGKTLYEPESGDLILTDTTTASTVSAAIGNFAADSDKIRRLLFMSVVATASYRCSGVISNPELSLTNTFYREKSHTGRQDLKDALGIPQALGLITIDQQIALLPSAPGSGRLHVSATASYDSALLDRLFFQEGQPHPADDYEKAARTAFARMIQPDDFDRDRRLPMLDDDLWKRFMAAGNLEQFRSLLAGRVSDQIINDMHVDYVTIRWWSTTMQSCATAIRQIRDFVSANPAVTPEDNRFQTLRRSLASTLATVASDMSAGFGEPWGLIAMDFATDHLAPTMVLITGPGVSVLESRPSHVTAASER